MMGAGADCAAVRVAVPAAHSQRYRLLAARAKPIMPRVKKVEGDMQHEAPRSHAVRRRMGPGFKARRGGSSPRARTTHRK